MSSSIVSIINAINPKSYLELGSGPNFGNITCKDKVSVDRNPSVNPIFLGTTDEFFKQNTRTFEIIFIDACHRIDYVLKDWNNSIKIATKGILMHDMVPPSAHYLQHIFSETAYYLLNYFMDNNVSCMVLNEDFGMTYVAAKDFGIEIQEVFSVDYQMFMQKIERIQKYTLETFIKNIV